MSFSFDVMRVVLLAVSRHKSSDYSYSGKGKAQKNAEKTRKNTEKPSHEDGKAMRRYCITRNYGLYSARTVNSAPEAKSRPFWEERAVKRR